VITRKMKRTAPAFSVAFALLLSSLCMNQPYLAPSAEAGTATSATGKGLRVGRSMTAQNLSPGKSYSAQGLVRGWNGNGYSSYATFKSPMQTVTW
jgi:hypothetical protein